MDAGVLSCGNPLAVVPVLVGPLQALMAMLPIILAALGGLLVALFKPTTIKRLALLLWAQKLVLVVLLAAIGGAVYLGARLLASPPASVASAESVKSDWPLWRGGLERRGYVPGQDEDPGHDRIVWSFSTRTIKAFVSSPSVVGNRVYAASARWLAFTKDGAIVSLDADDGKLVWKFDKDKFRPTFSSPAVQGKYLVIGEGLHLTNDARVFCLDVEESEKRREGVKLWDYRTASHVESSPCIADGLAFIGAGDDGMYCFQLEPQPDGNQVLWHLPGEQYRDCESSPVCLNGKLYFTLGLGYRFRGENAQAVVCVEARTGKEIWRIRAPCPVFGSPAIARGRMYVGMGHGDFINTAAQIASNLREEMLRQKKSEQEIAEVVKDIRSMGAVWCIDIAKAERDVKDAVIWKAEVGDAVLGTPAVDLQNGRVYFVSRDGRLYSVSAADGKDRREFNAHAPITSSPAVAKEHVYVVTGAKTLFGLGKADLTPVWEVPLGQMSLSSPTVARGHVYLGVGDPAATEGGLYCLGRPGREQQKALWAGALGGPGKSGRIDGSAVSLRGQYAWGIQGGNPKDPEDTSSPAVYAPAAYAQGAVYVGENRKGSSGLAQLRLVEKVVKGRKTTVPGDSKFSRGWFAPATNPIYHSAAVLDHAVFFVDGKPGDSDRALRCLDPATGRELWSRPVAAEASGEFTLARMAIVDTGPDGKARRQQQERLVIADSASGVMALDVSSPGAVQEIFQAATGPCVGCPLVYDDLVLVAVKEPPSLAALDAHTGAKLWERPLPTTPQTGCVLTAGRVWVGLPEGVRGEGILDSSPPVFIPCGPLACLPVFDRERIACVTAAGEVLLLRPDDGQEIGRIKDVAGSYPPLLAESSLLYLSKDAIKRFDFASGNSEQWAKLAASWPGRMTSPMVQVDSHLLFGTEKRGLVCMKPKD